MKRFTSLQAVLTGLAVVLVGCGKESAPKSDSTPPKLTLSVVKANGTQATIAPGETTAIKSADVTSPQGKNVRVTARDPEGVKRVDVTWSGTGPCHTQGTSQPKPSPSPLTFSFKPLSSVAPSGQVFTDLEDVQLEDQLAKADEPGISCGFHAYGAGGSEEYFWLLGGGLGTITVKAHAENCCKGGVDGTFTLKVG